MLTHDYLVSKANWWLSVRRNCPVVLTERGVDPARAGFRQKLEIADAIGWRWDMTSILVECKVSLADFKADKNKPHRKQGQVSLGQERWYLAPKGIIPVSEVPKHWGLLELKGNRIYRTKLPTKKSFNENTWKLESALIFTELARIKTNGQ